MRRVCDIIDGGCISTWCKVLQGSLLGHDESREREQDLRGEGRPPNLYFATWLCGYVEIGY